MASVEKAKRKLAKKMESGSRKGIKKWSDKLNSAMKVEEAQRAADMAASNPNAGNPNAPMVTDTTKRTTFGGRTGGTISSSNVPQWALELMQRLGMMGEQGLQQYAPNFAPIEEQARTGFMQNTIPSIAERFSSLGTGGSQRSSAFPQLLSQAGGNLEKDLAALKSQYGLDASKLFLGMTGQALQPVFNTDYMARQASPVENVITGFATGLGEGIPGAVTGGLGGVIGGGLGALGSLKKP